MEGRRGQQCQHAGGAGRENHILGNALSIAECRSVLYHVFLSGTHHGDRPAAVWVQKGMAELGRKGELVPCLRLYRQGYSESGGGACITKAENGHRRKESIVH